MAALATEFDFRWGYYPQWLYLHGTFGHAGGNGRPRHQTQPHHGAASVPKGETPKTHHGKFHASPCPVENLDTKTVPKGYSVVGRCGTAFTSPRSYVDSYPWANPFVGLSDYYGKTITAPSGEPLRVDLAQLVSVQPGDKPLTFPCGAARADVEL